MNNDFQIKFTLKQHTPMIHFQHEQSGATLRATELKPKLDKFILTQIGGGDYDAGCRTAKEKGWLVGQGEHDALDYKVKILAGKKVNDFNKLEEVRKFDKNTGKNKWETKNYPHLLANMGGKEKRKELKNFTFFQEIELIVFSFKNGLLEKLKDQLPKIFELENFGNRQSKGFGSFSVTKIDDKEHIFQSNFPYQFDWEVRGRDNSEKQKDLFGAIDIFYKTLRSGINYGKFDEYEKKFKPQFYFKSLLRDYVETELEEQWDKKTIKEKYFFGDTTKGEITHRDLLGFSTEESWGQTYSHATITKSSTTIERLASPILFKPVHIKRNFYKVFFRVSDVPDEFRASTILVQKNKYGNLKLHPSQKLKLSNYLQHTFSSVNIENHIHKYDSKELDSINHWMYTKIIKPIYQSIYNNLK